MKALVGAFTFPCLLNLREPSFEALHKGAVAGGEGRVGSGGSPDAVRLRRGLHGARPGRGRQGESHGVHQLRVRAGGAAAGDRDQGRGQAEDVLQQLRNCALPGLSIEDQLS